ncbi:MAG TPA: SMC-Scp complex subunit ScpB, partial [Nitrospiria bacterium]|nr:SMC-Scp complex subunit ScpB [Nitrospiria bacterium]
RGEIELVRGVDSAGVLKTLMDRRILKIVGRREGVGRPILYGTTQEFLKFFGLKDLSELPNLKDLKEIARETNGVDPEASIQEGSASEIPASVSGAESLPQT